MQDAAVISGSLVDVRNVGTHKSVKLTIHVPEELAMKVVAAFGWPTGAAPVSVAIACLDDKLPRRVVDKPPAETAPRPADATQPAGDVKPKRRFSDMSPAQQAGMLCDDVGFRRFIDEKICTPCTTVEQAADIVREYCEVTSRSELTARNIQWSELVEQYRTWQLEAEVVPA